MTWKSVQKLTIRAGPHPECFHIHLLEDEEHFRCRAEIEAENSGEWIALEGDNTLSFVPDAFKQARLHASGQNTNVWLKKEDSDSPLTFEIPCSGDFFLTAEEAQMCIADDNAGRPLLVERGPEKCSRVLPDREGIFLCYYRKDGKMLVAFCSEKTIK